MKAQIQNYTDNSSNPGMYIDTQPCNFPRPQGTFFLLTEERYIPVQELHSFGVVSCSLPQYERKACSCSHKERNAT